MLRILLPQKKDIQDDVALAAWQATEDQLDNNECEHEWDDEDEELQDEDELDVERDLDMDLIVDIATEETELKLGELDDVERKEAIFTLKKVCRFSWVELYSD